MMKPPISTGVPRPSAIAMSYANPDQSICPICGDACATDAGLCPPHQKLCEEGFLALVEVSNGRPDIKLGEAIHTGQVAHIRYEIFAKVFNRSADPSAPLVYVEPGVIESLQEMYEKEHGQVPILLPPEAG